MAKGAVVVAVAVALEVEFRGVSLESEVVGDRCPAAYTSAPVGEVLDHAVVGEAGPAFAGYCPIHPIRESRVPLVLTRFVFRR